MPVFDACVGMDMRLIHVRHEAAAVHMADAWGRLTGEPGIALLPAGPGFLNGLSALYSARMSESPVIVLSGHAPVSHIGQGAFQEIPQAEMAAALCKASWTVDKAVDLAPAVLEAAAIVVSGRPGPVHVALPFDLLNEEIDISLTAPPEIAPSGVDEDFSTVAQAIARAERPLILAGPLLAQPHFKSLRHALGEATGVPVVVMESPRGVNDPAQGAFAEIFDASDLVILLGRRADYLLRFGEVLADDVRVICIDPEEEELERSGKNLADRLILSIKADVSIAAERLIRSISNKENANAEWRKRVQEAIAYRPQEWMDLPDDPDTTAHPVIAARLIREVLANDPEAILVIDGGEFGQWAQACIDAPCRIINGPSGAIGAGLPFAIAARLAKPDSTVVVIMGDGTAGFCFAEFDTAVRNNIAMVAIIGNDAKWNAEYQIQLRDYGPERLIGCELGNARYDKAAEGLGCHGEFAPTTGAISACLKRAINSNKPACVNILIDGKPAPVIRHP